MTRKRPHAKPDPAVPANPSVADIRALLQAERKQR